MGQLLDGDPAVFHCREVVACRPPRGRAFQAQVVFARAERLHHHFVVAVVVVADAVEVIQPPVDWQVPPPVVGITAVDDAAARIDALDRVGAAAERRRERRLLEGHRRVIGLRDDRHEPEDQRQLAVRRLGVEDEAHRARIGPFDLPHLVVIEPVVGPALLLQRLPREDHVVDRDRAAVVECASGLKVKVTDERSSGTSIDSAISP